MNIIVLTVLAVAVFVLAAAIRKSAELAERSKEQERIFELAREREKANAEAGRETRAAQFYALQMAMEVIRTQANTAAVTADRNAETLRTAMDAINLQADAAAVVAGKNAETLQTAVVLIGGGAGEKTQRRLAARAAADRNRDVGRLPMMAGDNADGVDAEILERLKARATVDAYTAYLQDKAGRKGVRMRWF